MTYRYNDRFTKKYIKVIFSSGRLKIFFVFQVYGNNYEAAEAGHMKFGCVDRQKRYQVSRMEYYL